MRTILYLFLATLISSCIGSQKIIAKNNEFESFKNQADYKDCSGLGDKNFSFEPYVLINNKWGEDKIKSGNYNQCIYHKDGIVGWEWETPGRSYGVLGYPEIWTGSSAWGRKENITTPNYFKKLNKLKNLNVNFETFISTDDKKYNLAFDVWLHSEEITALETIEVELMVWEDHQKFKPFGKMKEIVSTSFGDYDLYYGIMKKTELGTEWIYIAFLRKEKRVSGKVDLKELLDFLVQKKYISKDLYLSSIEFGTEVLNSNGNIMIKNYEVEID